MIGALPEGPLGLARARVAQLAEAIGSNPMQCGFESRSGHLPHESTEER